MFLSLILKSATTWILIVSIIAGFSVLRVAEITLCSKYMFGFREIR